jgi:hypothetical protein
MEEADRATSTQLFNKNRVKAFSGCTPDSDQKE